MEKRTVAFIHGFLEDASMWEPLLRHISKSHLHILRPELPGHGRRRDVRCQPTIESYAEDVLSQMELDDDADVFLFGHSMGGYVAAALARLYPKKVRGLCLFHSKAGADSEEKKANRSRAIHAARENQALYVRTMISGLYHPDHRERHRNVIESQVRYATELPLQAIEDAQTAMMTRCDSVPALQSRAFPLYYFIGGNDSSLPAADIANEVAQLPGAVVHTAMAAGHMGHFEAPGEAGEFFQRILRADHP